LRCTARRLRRPPSGEILGLRCGEVHLDRYETAIVRQRQPDRHGAHSSARPSPTPAGGSWPSPRCSSLIYEPTSTPSPSWRRRLRLHRSEGGLARTVGLAGRLGQGPHRGRQPRDPPPRLPSLRGLPGGEHRRQHQGGHVPPRPRHPPSRPPLPTRHEATQPIHRRCSRPGLACWTGALIGVADRAGVRHASRE
jgi:hypothetical protein